MASARTASASFKWIPTDTREGTLRVAITRNGGEVVGADGAY
jgi:hypothetical protein